jgi:ABC-type transport system substrate-binding protein
MGNSISMNIYVSTKYIIRISTVLIVIILYSACQTSDEQLKKYPQTGIVKVGIPNWFETSNPLYEDSSAYSAWGPGIAYSRILKYTNSPDLYQLQNPHQLTCDVCAKWTMQSLTEFDFLIKDDIKWTNVNNNEEYLSAYDVEYSFKSKNESEFQNNHTLHMIETIQAKSDKNLSITLNYPDADFLTSIANGKNKIIKKNDTSSSSGSWILDEYIPYTLTRMSKSLDSKSIPNIDSIEFTYIPNDEARYSAYMVGLTDIYSFDDSESVFDDIKPKLLYRHSGLGLEFTINTKAEPFNDVLIRQALMYSINPTQIIEEAWSGRGYFSLGFPVSDKNWLPENTIWSNYFNSHSKATKILQESGISLPINIEITSSDYGEKYTKSLEIISGNLTAVGFNPSIKMLSRRDYSMNSVLAGDFQINIGPPFPQTTPNGYLLPMMHSSGKWNTSGYSNKYLDDLLINQSRAYNNLERASLIQEINIHVLDNAYKFMPVTTIEAWDWADNIQNFNPILKNDEYSYWGKIWVSQ